MKLEVGKNYTIELSSGVIHDVTIIADIGAGWYKVREDREYFLNLNLVVIVVEG